jgi:Spy/CpxP family protein refolding chaperone
MKIFGGLLLLVSLAWAEPGNVTRPAPSIFDYRQELTLSPQQIKDIKQAVRDLVDSSEKQTRRIQQLDLEYRQMLQREVPLEEAHAKLLEIERARTEWRYNDLKASYRILEILTAEQKKKWRQLKTKPKAEV